MVSLFPPAVHGGFGVWRSGFRIKGLPLCGFGV